MLKRLLKHAPMYMLAALLAAVLKHHYSTAEANQLKWILSPTATLVSLTTGIPFSFSAGEGFVSGSGSSVIAPACAGLNFLIICYCTLTFSFMRYAKATSKRLAVIASSLLGSFCLTLLVNTTRITLSIQHAAFSPVSAILSPEQIHRYEGIFIYFLALSLIYCLAGLLVRRYLHDSRPIRLSLLAPLFWYIAVMIGIPIMRGAFHDNTPAFLEHCAVVALVPLLIILIIKAIAWAHHRLRAVPFARLSTLTAVCIAPIAFLCLRSPLPPIQSFDTGHNAIWLSEKWYTGAGPSTHPKITTEDITALILRLRGLHIRYAYVRAGRITEDGTLQHMPGNTFFALQKQAPDMVFLPWIAGNGDSAQLDDPRWRDEVVQQLGRLYAGGIGGVHLNIEPVHDKQTAYVDLLREIRERLDGEFFVSHATVRVAPLGLTGAATRNDFWSRDFYRATMEQTDQTVLMGYNTALPSSKLYRSYIRHQTGKLLDWSSDIDGHQVLIGIPCYDGISRVSNPRVENIPNALSGISSALSSRPALPSHFEGTALYANWHLSDSESDTYQKHWIK